MATHTDTQKLVGYNAGLYPSLLGNPERFISNELSSIQTSINKIIEVMKLLEGRMNSNNLT